jgi:predicted phosphodiesterase
MSRLTDALARAEQVAQARAVKRSHPDGWEPGVRWDEATRLGELTIKATAPRPDWDSFLREWGFDPAVFEVAGDTIQFRTWDGAIGNGETQRFYYYRAQIRSRRPDDHADVAELISEIRKRKPRPVAPVTGDQTLVVALADWQAGDAHTDEAVERILRLVDEIPARWRELVKTGVPLRDILLVGLGDLVEGCSGDWYPSQTFQATLNNREQRTLVRRLLVKIIEACLTVSPTVRVAVVGGNHGEARQGGKAYTDPSDNSDVEVAEQAAEVIAAHPEYRDRVSFIIPRDELAVTLNVHGVILGLTHGHLAKRGAGAANKVENWWKGQALGMTAAGDATLLLTGHYHHLVVQTHGPRTHIQAPAMCGPSAWFTDLSGVGNSGAGTLTLVVGTTGWDHLRVIAR